MHVPIDDEHAVETMLRDGDLRGERDVVEQAETDTIPFFL
jgi:hypothetical protein